MNDQKRLEAEIGARNVFLSAIIENNPLASVVVDSNNRIRLCNPAFERLFGWRFDEIAERDLDSVIVPAAYQEVARQYSDRTLGGEVLHETALRQRQDGSLVDVEIHGAPLFLDGKLEGIFAVYEDISARTRAEKEIRAAEAHYRELVEQLPGITYVAEFGETGCWQYVSPQIETFLGFSREEWLAGRGLWFGQVLEEDRQRVMAAESRMRRSGEELDVEYRMRAKDGRLLWFRDHATLARDTNGRTCMHGFMFDITDRKEAETALLKLSRQTNMILNSAGDGIFGLDREGRPTFVNHAGAKMLGYKPEEIIGRPGHALWHHTKPDGSPFSEAECPISAILRDGITRRENDDIFWRKDGSSFPVEYVGTAIREDEEVLGAVVTFRDITVRQRAEKAQRQAEERFRSIFENAVEGIYQSTPDGKFISVNPAMARMFGYNSPAEMIESVSNISRQIYSESAHREDFKRGMEERGIVTAQEARARRKDGSPIWISENARAVRNVIGRICYYEGTLEDITARKRAETERQVSFEIIHAANVTDNLDELLHRIHQSLKKILYAENCFVALYDPIAGVFEFPFWADKYDPLPPPPQKLGRSCTAYVFRKAEAMLIPQSVFDDLAAAGEVELVGAPAPGWLGVPLRTPSETIGVLVVQHYMDERAYTPRDMEFLSSVGGQIALAIQRKRAETGLRDSEARLRVLIEQLPAVLWTTDRELRFTSSVGAGLARLGLKPHEIVGKSLYEYFQTDDRTFLPISAHRRALSGESVTYHTEWGGGSYACHAEPLREGGEILGVIAMALDITDRKQLEAQLRQAQKMEAVGRLAGGIAHDFNNLLMVIQGYTELLLDRIGSEHPLRRNAEQIQDASKRAASLTRQLLAFSRKQMLAPQILNLQSVVSDMEKILRRLIGEDIELVTVNAPEMWSVKADRSQLEQVILNLAVNSRDAMADGGKLTIETSNVELDRNYSRQAVVEPGEYVLLAVSDTGCGMDPQTQAHIFEPFFTTKEKGKGTGLGLATVYGIVKQSGGYVWVYSEPGKGATFKIYLPRVKDSAQAIEPKPETAAATRGSETILLVEDEAGVRELAREYLTQIGYRVLEAENAQRALEIAREHPERIDLLFTDVVMGGISGRQLAEEMEKLRPGIKVLYMSGYADEAIVHHGILGRGSVLLQKPFTLNSLALKVRETLASSEK